MVSIRRFSESDLDAIRANLYPDMGDHDFRSMVQAWDSGSWQGKFFEMLGIFHDREIVGTISLYEHSKSVASIGIEVFESQRRKGYAYEANLLLLAHAKQLGYRVIVNQVRAENAASIRLNEKLGFESDFYIYKNKKDRPVFLFLKAL